METITGAGGAGSADGPNGSSRCGFPQRWQNRASGGNSVPQVQNSAIQISSLPQ